jgi:hypothetical protein
MKISVLPKTSLGKWSLGLIMTQYLGLISTMLFHLAWAAGIIAFFVGIISIIKNKERTVLVFLSTLLGFINICIIAYSSFIFF